MQVNLAVVFNVEAGRSFQVGEVVRVWQLKAKMLAYPFPNLGRWRNQIHPDGLATCKVLRSFDVRLTQATVVQLEDIDHHLGTGLMAVTHQGFSNVFREQLKDVIQPFLGKLLPDKQALFLWERVQNQGNGYRGKASQQVPKLGDMLALNQIVHHLFSWRLLPTGHLADQAMFGEKFLNFEQVVLDRIYLNDLGRFHGLTLQVWHDIAR